MATLGNLFPEKQIDQHITDHFKVGCVIRVEVAFPQITKPKYLILVADNDPECLTFIINSEIHSFIANKPHLAQCQVNIDAANHPFLDHDSIIACHDVLVLKRSDVFKELKKDTGKIKGRVSNDVLLEIKSAIKIAKTLSPEVKTVILSSLDGLGH